MDVVKNGGIKATAVKAGVTKEWAGNQGTETI